LKNVRSANILLLLAAAGVSLAACEVALRIFYPGLLIQDNVWPPHLSMRFNPAPGIMPGVSGESVFTTNSYGIRGDELSGQYARRILAVGGSATECLYLSQAKSWPYLLQRKLDGISGKNNVWVGNAGMSGANTNHHIKLLRYFPLARLKIDTLIILAGINDFSRRLALDQDYVPFYVKEESDLPVVMRTALGRLLVKTGQVFSKQEKEITQDNAGKVYVAWRSNRRSAKDKIDVLPDMSSALGEYRQNVNTIIDIAKRN
jgi:lysophospholipase L1-like esterase